MILWDRRKHLAEKIGAAEDRKRRNAGPKEGRRTSSAKFVGVTRAERDRIRKEIGWEPPKQKQ